MNLAYDGSGFCGWQVQPNARTVQGCIEDALRSLLRNGSLSIVGCGRTDTGVNASYYVAHFDFDELDCVDLCYRLNSVLPKEISIFSIEAVGEDFHARFGASRREYRYYIHTAKDSFKRGYSHLYTYHLDIDAMNGAAEMLVGTHDFSCFEKSGADNKTSVCTVFQAGWLEYEPEIRGEGKYYCFRISADRFLRNMVRAIVGTLLDVGRGKRSQESIQALLESRSRCDAGESVPGHALFLSKVDY